jgi:LytR cell envelope-related transcriptional attenuator
VEHAYTTREPVTPWRTAAVVAAGVAAVELFILIVIGIVFGAKVMTDKAETVIAQTQETRSESPRSADGQTPTKLRATAAVAELPRSRTSVIVLNGNGIPAAAAIASEKVRKFHYIIAGTGNAPRTDFQRSLVMFRPGFEGEANRLAKDLKVKRVAPLDGVRKSDLQGAHIAYIVGG